MSIKGRILAAILVAGTLAPVAAVAGAVEKTDGFVCPVFNDDSQAGAKNPQAQPIAEGDSTIVGPEVSVPTGATNGDGAGSPAGAHSPPGDRDYTAVWGG